MTRDEAIKSFAGIMNHPQAEYLNETVARVTPMIDGFIALGMLKLDEVKSPEARFLEALAPHGIHFGTNAIFTILDVAGLKIVEK